MKVRVVVADLSEADFYDVERLRDGLRFAGGLGDPSAHLHDRDLAADRPGRVFDRAPTGTARRGSMAHHSTNGERRPRKHAAEQFARQVATVLDSAHRDGEFARLVLVAAPEFLGLLRAALPSTLRSIVVAQIARDLVHLPRTQLPSFLPQDIFRTHLAGE